MATQAEIEAAFNRMADVGYIVHRDTVKAALEAAERARLDEVPKFRTCSVCGQEAHNCKCLSPSESK